MPFFIKHLDGDVRADEHIQQAMMINIFGKLGMRVESQAGFRERFLAILGSYNCGSSADLTLLGNSFKLPGKASGKLRGVWEPVHPHRAMPPHVLHYSQRQSQGGANAFWPGRDNESGAYQRHERASEMVASMPSRRAYCLAKARVCCRRRAS